MQAANFDTARFNMVEQQIRPCDVIDENVLNVMRTMPREKFVPGDYQQLAFADIHVPLNQQSVMMKPVQEGTMLQALAVNPEDRILEVGTGSGYITACLAKLGKTVISYEIDATLSQQAEQRLDALAIHNVSLVVGDVFDAGFGERSFDVIAVTGSTPDDIDMLEKLLASGGRMYFIKGEPPVMSATLVMRDQNDNLYQDSLGETLLPPLQNTPPVEKFVF